MSAHREPSAHDLVQENGVELQGQDRRDLHDDLSLREPAALEQHKQFSGSGSRDSLDEVDGVPVKGGKGAAGGGVDGLPQPSPAVSDEEAAAARQKRRNIFARIVNVILPNGGLLSGVFNLASVTLGAGIMSIPASFNTSGMIMAIIYLVVITSLTVFSITLLSLAMHKTGIYSFEGLARALFGRGGDIFVAVLMWLLCFGGAVGYVIAIGDIFKPIFNHPTVPAFLQEARGRRCIMSGVWLLFMLPLVLPKKINSLRYVSAIGFCFIVLFVICVIYHSAAYGLQGGIRQDLVMVRPGNAAVSGLAIFCFSYLCQVNVGRIVLENKDRSTRQITLQAIISCSLCGTLYFLTGFFGYAEFGPALTGNILEKFDPYQSPVFFVVFIGLIVKLCAAFSLNMLACRTALFQVVQWDVETMPYWKHTVISVPFAIGALILGLFVPDISIVFGLAGSLCGGFIGFVFPALFIMYAGNWSLKTVGIWYYLGTYFLLLCGVISIVFGTGSSIYSTVIKYS